MLPLLLLLLCTKRDYLQKQNTINYRDKCPDSNFTSEFIFDIILNCRFVCILTLYPCYCLMYVHIIYKGREFKFLHLTALYCSDLSVRAFPGISQSS